MQFLRTNEVRQLQANGQGLSEAEIYSARQVEDEAEQVETDFGTIMVMPGDYVMTMDSSGKQFGVAAQDIESAEIWQPL